MILQFAMFYFKIELADMWGPRMYKSHTPNPNRYERCLSTL